MQHKVGIKEKQRLQLEAELENLSKALMDANCLDEQILQRTDRLMRMIYTDISRGWVRWAYYIATKLFNSDFKRYEEWAKNNCKNP